MLVDLLECYLWFQFLRKNLPEFREAVQEREEF